MQASGNACQSSCCTSSSVGTCSLGVVTSTAPIPWLSALACVPRRVYPGVCTPACVPRRVYPGVCTPTCVPWRVYPGVCTLAEVSCSAHRLSRPKRASCCTSLSHSTASPELSCTLARKVQAYKIQAHAHVTAGQCEGLPSTLMPCCDVCILPKPQPDSSQKDSQLKAAGRLRLSMCIDCTCIYGVFQGSALQVVCKPVMLSSLSCFLSHCAASPALPLLRCLRVLLCCSSCVLQVPCTRHSRAVWGFTQHTVITQPLWIYHQGRPAV
jgi:hypothetical protein